MNTFIKTIRDNLKVVVKIREELIENKTAINKIRGRNERVFQIYSVDIPQVLIKILEELNLIWLFSDSSEVNVSTIYANFYKLKTIHHISEAYRQVEEYNSLHLLVDRLSLLTKEMQGLADASNITTL